MYMFKPLTTCLLLVLLIFHGSFSLGADLGNLGHTQRTLGRCFYVLFGKEKARL